MAFFHADVGWEQIWESDRRDIREAISVALRNYDQELFLYSEGLFHMPIQVCRLTQLQRLHLGANELTCLPEGLAQLKGLQERFCFAKSAGNILPPQADFSNFCRFSGWGETSSVSFPRSCAICPLYRSWQCLKICSRVCRFLWVVSPRSASCSCRRISCRRCRLRCATSNPSVN